MKLILSLVFIIFNCFIIVGGNLAIKPGEFAIYLTKDDIPPVQMLYLSHYDISEKPVISQRDIVTYNEQTHELKLTPSSFERIASLDVPVQGRSFVVCVGKKPVYWGAFWNPVSSISFNGVTIWKPYTDQDPAIVKLELGYPSPDFYSGNDPRNSPEILKNLEHAGKLITTLRPSDSITNYALAP
ncbi:MAG TPA: hypothetical protein VMB24_00365 [Dehalococcoidales bacterium]|nr:hypothetical protein [Dehalococcoidales bacterium]